MTQQLEKFDVALEELLKGEGGISRERADSASSIVRPGEAHTNLGITLKVVRQLDADGHLSAFLRDELDVDDDGDIDAKDVEGWTRQTARLFYRLNYWEASDCHRLLWPVSNLVFDLAVNAGKVTAIKCLQRALRLRDDGILGPDTYRGVDRLRANSEAIEDLLKAFTVAKLEFYRENKSADAHFRGWAKRSVDVLIFSLMEA